MVHSLRGNLRLSDGDKELEANQRAVSAVASIISSDDGTRMSVSLTNVDYVVQLKLAIASSIVIASY